MAHPAPDSTEPIRPNPIVSVVPPGHSSPPTTTEESGAHHSHRFGFSLGDEEARAAGIPPERRPLTRRGIRNWTIGSLLNAALFGAVAAVALSRVESQDAKTAHAPLAPVALPAQTAAAPPAPATAPPNVIPLAALPISKERKPTAHAASGKTTHRVKPAHVTLTAEPRTATSAKTWSSRVLVPENAKAKTTTKAATVTKKPVR